MTTRRSLMLALLLLATPAAAEEITLKTADGMRLKADWHAPPAKGGKGVVVALHMFRSDRKAFQPLVEPLREAGLGLLAVDMRGHGQSVRQKGKDLSKAVKARDAALFNAMYRDAAAAVAFAKRKGYGPGKVVLLGASVGCSVALHYASTDPAVRAAVLLTPGKKYLGVPSLEHIAKWGKRPILIVSSKEEADKGARPLYQALPHRGSGALLIVPQTKVHGTRMFGKIPKIERRLASWMAAHL